MTPPPLPPAANNRPAARVELALVSHTNNGKTTLARTLLGRDVGEVRDAANVTDRSEAHALIGTESGDVLMLWDTPGFGDSVRLARRLAASGNPIGWFLSEVWDRWRDRPFWLAQQALRAARDAADVVLYLVNAAEDPADTGYLQPELQILQWLGRPVLVLLNQTGAPREGDADAREQARWREHLAGHPIVRGVLTLDAFTLSWVHEQVFFDAVAPLLPAAKQAGYARLVAAWRADNDARFERSMQAVAAQIGAAACDQQALPPATAGMRVKSVLSAVGIGQKVQDARQQQAMDQLLKRLQLGIESSTQQLLELHHLAPGAAAEVNERVREHFDLKAPLSEAQAGLLGAVLTGAAVGLKADVVSGGLTMGAGALIGGVVGALTFASAAWGFNELDGRHAAQVRFSEALLRNLLTAGVLRYLTVAHFGRGRGHFAADPAPEFWRRAVEAAMDRHAADLPPLWRTLRDDDPSKRAAAQTALDARVRRLTRDALHQLYPHQVAAD